MTISFADPIYLWALLLIPLAWGLAALAPRALSLFRRRLSLVLRTLVLLLVILALAGTQLRRSVDNLTVVFLVDVSDSMPSGTRQQAAEFLRGAIEAMPAGDQAAVVVFGKEALVERTASDIRRFDSLASVPVATRTNIADAIQLGLALLPADMQKRLVLLSDGQQNEGDARAAAKLVAAREVLLDSVAIGGAIAGPEVQVTELSAPNTVPFGQRFELAVRLLSNQETTVRLRIFGDNQVIYDQAVEVSAGGSTYRIPLEAEQEGFQRYRAVIDGAEDTRPQNNEAAAFTRVTGQPSVALVTNKPEQASPLIQALEGSQMRVERFFPNALPQTLEELINFDSIVLVGVEAPELPRATIETLPTFVRDVGHGLVMIGGPEGFGAGQWLRTPVEEALPVDMEVQPKDRQANIALVLAVDKSGSMGRCHCDDPNNAQQEQQRRQSGLPKVDIAKDAVIQATAALGTTDFVGVVAFDGAARWALETQRFPGLASLEDAVAPIDANGDTNIFAALTLAEESLTGANAKIKHIILLTDGWSRAGDHKALAERYAEKGITLSVVAAGSGSAQDLDDLAEAGGGKYYPAASMEDVPQIFLKETIRIAGRYIIEEPFYPTLMNPNSSILAGLPLNEGVPPLVGYNGSTLKADATEILRTSQGDPLLATRRYGLGRTVAWTSDLSPRWASDWLAWEGFADFASQLVAWSFPDPQVGDLRVQARQEGSRTFIEVNSTDDQDRPLSADTQALIVGPDGGTVELTVPQVGAGEYRVELPSDAIGAYFTTITQRDENGDPLASTTRGLVVPYSPEYRLQQPDETLLSQIATQTGGNVRNLSQPGAVFEHPPQHVTRAEELWPWLLLLALILFPFDIAVRRIIFGQREWERLRTWISRQPTQPEPAEPLLGSLLQAKERASRRDPSTLRQAQGTANSGTQVEGTPPAAKDAAPPTFVAPTTPPPPSAPAPETSQKDPSDAGETLARLRQAKKRRKRR
ncbi:MAG: VWA domain-containing protein [Ardenticatenaceae bacterium]